MTPEGRTAMEKAAGAKAPAGTHEVRLTTAAAERFRVLVVEQDIPEEERNLRIAVRAGGCSGFSYEIGFDARHPEDLVAESEGVRVVVDPPSLPHLEGAVVDFVDTVQEQGFKVTNPNAKSSCGCGQSFQS